MAEDRDDIARQTLVVRERKTPSHTNLNTEAPVYSSGMDTADRWVGAGAAQQAPEVGQQLGSYRLLKLLGDGASGRVFLAEHTILDRHVAIKMLHPELNNDPKLVRRFFGEAKAVSQLAHENIVSIMDFVVSVEHPSFYVMEFLEGDTLADRLDRVTTLPASQVVDWGAQLASALDAAHRKNIVHRDLKPANVFLAQKDDGQTQVKLLDFGVAKLSLPSNSQKRLTQIGTMIGSPTYMAPEATYGLDLDARADLYSLGIVLYEMLTGHAPFEASTIEDILAGHREQIPMPPRSVAPQPDTIPAELEQLILKCLAKKVADRPESAQEVVKILRNLSATSTEPASIPEATVMTAPTPPPKRKFPVVLVGCILLGLAGSLILWRQMTPPIRVVGISEDSLTPVPADQTAAENSAPDAPANGPETSEGEQVVETLKIKIEPELFEDPALEPPETPSQEDLPSADPETQDETEPEDVVTTTRPRKKKRRARRNRRKASSTKAKAQTTPEPTQRNTPPKPPEPTQRKKDIDRTTTIDPFEQIP